MTTSYTKLSTFERCPYQYEAKYILKIKEPPSEALARGNAEHDKCERYLRGKLKRVPKTLEKIGPHLKRLKEFEAVPEQWWNLTDDWGWSDKKFQWLVAKLDAYCFPTDSEIEVIDFKTGKKYPEVRQQLNLYATCAMSIFDVDLCTAKAIYVDTGDVVTLSWDIDQYEAMKNSWTARVKRLESCKVFKKKPGFYCNWCIRHTSKGGDCNGKS